MLAVMLTAQGADGLMLYTKELAVHVAGGNVDRAVSPPTVAACSKVAADAVDSVAGGASARAGRTERLPVDAAHQGMLATGGAPARAAVGQSLWTGKLVADVAGQGVFAAERMAVTGAEGGAASANGLLTLVAGQRVCPAVKTPTLCAGCEAVWTKTTCAARGGAALKMDVAVVALAGGV